MTRKEIRKILEKECLEFKSMTRKEQEGLIDVECYIDNHAPRLIIEEVLRMRK